MKGFQLRLKLKALRFNSDEVSIDGNQSTVNRHIDPRSFPEENILQMLIYREIVLKELCSTCENMHHVECAQQLSRKASWCVIK